MTFFEYNTPQKTQEQHPVRLMSSMDNDDREEERISALQEEASMMASRPPPRSFLLDHHYQRGEDNEEDNLDWEMLLDEDDSSLSDSEESNHNFSVELENTPHAGFASSILDALETNSLTLVRGVRRSNPTTRNNSDIPGDISIDDSQDFVDYTYTMPSDDAGEDNENSRSRQESSRPRRPRSNWRRSHHRRSISSRRRLPRRSIVVSE